MQSFLMLDLHKNPYLSKLLHCLLGNFKTYGAIQALQYNFVLIMLLIYVW